MGKRVTKGFKSDNSKLINDQASAVEQKFREYIQQHEWGSAVTTWIKWINANPNCKSNIREKLKRYVLKGVDNMRHNFYTEASSNFCKALAYDKNNVDALANLSIIELERQRPEQALQLIELALKNNDKVGELWKIKLDCMSSLGQIEGADEIVEKATSLGINRQEILVNYANNLKKRNPDAAINLCRSILKSENLDDIPDIHYLLTITRYFSCFETEMVDWIDQLKKRSPETYPKSFLTLLHTAATEEENKSVCMLLNEYRAWLSDCIAKNPLGQIDKKRINNRNIRIGFVGGDFYEHVVSRFLLPLIKSIGPLGFDSVCISTRERPEDESRKQYRQLTDFVEVNSLNYRDTAALIRQKKLDICVDTSGFTLYGGSMLMAHRLAPIQLSMLGYPGSTFTPNIDYLVGDKTLKPEHDWMYPEKFLEVDGLAYCIETPDDKFAVDPLPPQIKNKKINFGTLISPSKYTKSCIKIWARVLKKVPDSQMVFVRPECKSNIFNQNIINEFALHGIGKERLVTVDNHSKNVHYLTCITRLDMCLDTTPMTGGTSTYESILMGVPVVTLTGPNYHQKISESVLEHTGLQQFIAQSEDEYVDIATTYCKDIDLLTKIREQAISLRNKQTMINDQQGYSHRFSKALLNMLNNEQMLGEEWQARLTRE